MCNGGDYQNPEKGVREMLKKLMVLFAVAAFVVTVSACGKQDQEAPGAPAGGKPAGDVSLPQKGQEAVVNVPADVKSKWKGIKIKVEDKKNKTAKEYTVKLGESMNIAGTKLSVKAVDYLPAFVMQGLNITSASNEQNNPAAKIVVTEGGAEIFKGWLFQKFPTTHAFSHPDFSITLLEGVSS